MGLEGDLLGRKDLGLPILAPVAVVVVEVVGTVVVIASMEVSKVVPLVVVIGTSSEGPNDTTQFCPFPEAKKCLADARASSWLASLILWTLLEISGCLVLCLSDALSDVPSQRYKEFLQPGLTRLQKVEYLPFQLQGLQVFTGLL